MAESKAFFSQEHQVLMYFSSRCEALVTILLYFCP